MGFRWLRRFTAHEMGSFFFRAAGLTPDLSHVPRLTEPVPLRLVHRPLFFPGERAAMALLILGGGGGASPRARVDPSIA